MTEQKEKCHYCKVLTSNEKDNYYEHTLYGVTNSSLVPGAVYSYVEKKVLIPRCEQCEKRHNDLFLFIELPLFLIGFCYMLWDFTYNVSDSGFRFLSLIPSVVAGIACAGIVGQIIRFFLNFRHNEGKSEEDITDFPEIKKLTKLGWRINKPAKGEYLTKEDYIKTE